MGAYLALKVSSLLEETGRQALLIFVSGNAGPGVSTNKNHHLLNNEDFIIEVGKLGGLPREVLESKDLIEIFTPILKADFEIVSEALIISSVINSPIIAMMGDLEENVGEIRNWQTFTNTDFKYRIFEGEHFFIYDHPKEISKLIRQNYDIVFRNKCASRL